MEIRTLVVRVDSRAVVELLGLRSDGDGYRFSVYYYNQRYIDEEALGMNRTRIEQAVREILKSRGIVLGETAELVMLSEGRVHVVIK